MRFYCFQNHFLMNPHLGDGRSKWVLGPMSARFAEFSPVRPAEPFRPLLGEVGAEASLVLLADSHQIIRALGVRDPRTRERLSAAVAETVVNRRPTVALWREADDYSIGRLITVRPAREWDKVVVGVDTLDPTPSALTAPQLSELFGLSRSEGEIALSLLRDGSPADIADFRGVQLETVRGQIKTILRKIGVTSQKQLIRVLSQVSAALA